MFPCKPSTRPTPSFCSPGDPLDFQVTKCDLKPSPGSAGPQQVDVAVVWRMWNLQYKTRLPKGWVLGGQVVPRSLMNTRVGWSHRMPATWSQHENRDFGSPWKWKGHSAHDAMEGEQQGLLFWCIPPYQVSGSAFNPLFQEISQKRGKYAGYL